MVPQSANIGQHWSPCPRTNLQNKELVIHTSIENSFFWCGCFFKKRISLLDQAFHHPDMEIQIISTLAGWIPGRLSGFTGYTSWYTPLPLPFLSLLMSMHGSPRAVRGEWVHKSIYLFPKGFDKQGQSFWPECWPIWEQSSWKKYGFSIGLAVPSEKSRS